MPKAPRQPRRFNPQPGKSNGKDELRTGYNSGARSQFVYLRHATRNELLQPHTNDCTEGAESPFFLIGIVSLREDDDQAHNKNDDAYDRLH
ncbi:hypothetical protein [Bradyrhizobium sp. USDA 3315]